MWGRTIASISLMVFLFIGYFVLMWALFDCNVLEDLLNDDTKNN